MNLNLGLQELAIPILLVVAVNGYRRGWKKELITAGTLFFAIFLLDRAGSVLVRIANRIPAVFLMLLSSGLGQSENGQVHTLTAPNVFTTANQVVLYALAFLGLAFFAYWLGSALGGSGLVSGLGRLGGAVIAPFNAFILAERLVRYWDTYSRVAEAPTLGGSVTVRLQPGASAFDLERYLPVILIVFLVGAVVFLLARWRFVRG